MNKPKINCLLCGELIKNNRRKTCSEECKLLWLSVCQHERVNKRNTFNRVVTTFAITYALVEFILWARTWEMFQ